MLTHCRENGLVLRLHNSWCSDAGGKWQNLVWDFLIFQICVILTALIGLGWNWSQMDCWSRICETGESNWNTVLLLQDAISKLCFYNWIWGKSCRNSTRDDHVLEITKNLKLSFTPRWRINTKNLCKGQSKNNTGPCFCTSCHTLIPSKRERYPIKPVALTHTRKCISSWSGSDPCFRFTVEKLLNNSIFPDKFPYVRMCRMYGLSCLCC